MAKFCSNCGKELSEDKNVCLNCGISTGNLSNTDKIDRNALVGFILGLVSIVTWIIPIFGYATGICGLVFSAKGMNSKVNKAKAITGLVLCIVFLVFSLINSIAGVCINLSNYYDNYYYYY